MVNKGLVKDYIKRAKIRLDILREFLKREDHSDVIREAQEIIELIQKAILMIIDIEPPKWHDVMNIINANKEKLPEEVQNRLPNLTKVSKWLRGLRELAFYGAPDFLPTEDFSREDAEKAIEGAQDFFQILEILKLKNFFDEK